MKFVEFTSIQNGKRVSIDSFSILHFNEMEDGTDIVIDTMHGDCDGFQPACIAVSEPYDVVVARIRTTLEGM